MPLRVLPSWETAWRKVTARPWPSLTSTLEKGAANLSLKVRETKAGAATVAPLAGVAETRREWAATGAALAMTAAAAKSERLRTIKAYNAKLYSRRFEAKPGSGSRPQPRFEGISLNLPTYVCAGVSAYDRPAGLCQRDGSPTPEPMRQSRCFVSTATSAVFLTQSGPFTRRLGNLTSPPHPSGMQIAFTVADPVQVQETCSFMETAMRPTDWVFPCHSIVYASYMMP